MTIMSNKAQKSKEKTINKQSHYKVQYNQKINDLIKFNSSFSIFLEHLGV